MRPRQPPAARARPARTADGALLVALQREFYVEDRMTHAPANARALRRLLRTPEAGSIWVIEAAEAREGTRGRASVGYLVLTLGWSLELGGRDAFIDELYVRPGWRGRGLGALALATAERAARRLGVRAIHLEVDVPNEGARRLYRRAGFQLRERYQLMVKRLAESTR